MRRSPVGNQSTISRRGRPSSSKSSSIRYERIHVSSCARCSGFSRTSASGTWCARHVPSTGRPSTTFGPVQPFGVRRTIIGQRGRVRSLPRRARVLDARGSRPARGRAWPRAAGARRAGSSPATRYGSQPYPVEELGELRLGDTREHSRVRDLVAVEVQDREHRAVADRVEELVRMPARRERARLGLAVADDARDDEIGIVERGAERVPDRVAELAAFVDRARRLRRDVARHAARERELPEQPLHPLGVARDRRDTSRCSCPRATCWRGSRARRDRDRSRRSCRGRRGRSRGSRCAYSDVQPRARAPVAEEARLHVGRPSSGCCRSALASR